MNGDGGGADLRSLLVELSRQEETARSVVQAVLGGLFDPKTGAPKSADAIKVFELLCRLQAEDFAGQAAALPSDADLSGYTDEQLIVMEAALARDLEAAEHG